MIIILVTHRVQSAKLADRIYIIENGVITSKGSPKQLAKKKIYFLFHYQTYLYEINISPKLWKISYEIDHAEPYIH